MTRLPGAAVDRVSQADLAMLASDSGRLRQQIGALLLLGDGPPLDPGTADRLLAERISAVPRLRQRIVRVPLGGGQPIWLDDPAVDPARHVRRRVCPHPADEEALLALAADLVTEPLPRDRPLWSATWLIGPGGERVALVVVLHHAVLDGLRGVGVLHRLADAAAAERPSSPPRRTPPPTYGRLVSDAWRERLHAVQRIRGTRTALRRALRAGGGVHPRPAASCSLLAPTGPRRRFAVVRADLAGLRAAGHRCGGTVNDVLLAAVAGALSTLLAHRGEPVDPLLVCVMVGSRAGGDDGSGNAATPLVVAVPAVPDPVERLRRVAGTVRRARSAAAGPSVITLLGPAFRAMAALGGYRWYQARQHRFHTLLSNVPGPGAPMSLAGAPVSAVVPLANGETGNVTVSFLALSYAGTLTMTVAADADAVPDLSVLAHALDEELAVHAPVRGGARSAADHGGRQGVPDTSSRTVASTGGDVATTERGPTPGPCATPGPGAAGPERPSASVPPQSSTSHTEADRMARNPCRDHPHRAVQGTSAPRP
ncbi:WS/DGAT domain-containing protein [Geodermatophilus sp. YIM 151500]|uniref:wax ester/triacylglycerol synthase domain-containing protein n=1 Tax=Geodermatophilus sp. YIM 151500 TaxID=2984531 RepID=UPI0021E3CDDA|nr:wax ester/triacylglycerol synthase domain-containing protein [Geodermatophilus sp. YIM 151500]MCV2487888.1 WS/DGAT domain-containing protein [Geodermatophilus sp. YIM 151500]